MKKAKLDLFFSFFPYSGNGASASEHPASRKWFASTLFKAKTDERVGTITGKDFCDTPITMTRNVAVQAARAAGADVLVMCDSDMVPDYELGRGDPLAKPFWDTAFDFLYERFTQGLITVVAAPYCGPPPEENVYLFRWTSKQSEHPNADAQLVQFTRAEAAVRGGFEEAGALPTGLILWDLRAFDLVDPPYFYYEYRDKFECEKDSTEDVTATRDVALACQALHGYSPLFVAWDCWAGHVKPKVVGKPRPFTTATVAAKLQTALRDGVRPGQQLVDVGAGRPKRIGRAR